MRVSVVTPSYNQGQFIERTITSILTQDSSDVEYVVFDGGSQDETLSILRKYQGRLRWVSEKDKGQANAVNKGIKATSGEIIGWLNSDDIYYPGAVRTVVNFFRAHPDVDVVYGTANHIDKSDCIIEPYSTECWNPDRLKETCYICQPATFFRRRVVERYGLLDETLQYCMDYEYWLRLALGGANFVHLPQSLAGSRLYLETKTLGARNEVHREINAMMRKCLGQIPARWLSNYAHVVLHNKGLSRENNPLAFIFGLAVVSLYAAFRWNRGVSKEMRSTIWRWVRRHGEGCD
ncbi:MAG: glycosyltransferase family 2 protein [Bacteroidota bacterium]